MMDKPVDAKKEPIDKEVPPEVTEPKRSIWKWINNNSSAIIAISTVVLVFTTGLYVIFTYSLAKDTSRLAEDTSNLAELTRKASEEEQRPYVYCIDEDITLEYINNRIELGFPLFNAGKIPALLDSINITVETGNSKQEVPGVEDVNSERTIFANDKSIYRVELTPNSTYISKAPFTFIEISFNYYALNDDLRAKKFYYIIRFKIRLHKDDNGKIVSVAHWNIYEMAE
ncbi:hypothetical protein ACFL4X_02595 [Gemmatimonadota bacterium]